MSPDTKPTPLRVLIPYDDSSGAKRAGRGGAVECGGYASLTAP